MLVAAAWTVFVWINRMINLVGDDRSTAFIAVHVALAVVSIALAVPVGIVGWKLGRGGGPPRS